MTVYMNLHPSYDYSTAILGNDGYLEIREYVKSVDWIFWAGMGRTAKRELHICGKLGDHELAKVQHIERAYVFGQRLEEAGCTVLVRDSRGDEWQPFQNRGFTHEEMFEIECQLNNEPDMERWAKDIQRYEDILERVKENGDEERITWVTEALQDAREQPEEWQRSEEERKNFIKNFWTTAKLNPHSWCEDVGMT